MSNHHTRADALPKAVTEAHDALVRAHAAYHAALREAFPIGSPIVSYARRNPIRGKVVGIPQHSSDLGYVAVENNVTGKVHKACARNSFCDVEAAP